MSTQLTRDLRLTFPVETEKSGTVQVYSLPLSRMIFERFVLELGSTYSQCFGSYDPRHVAMTAPQMAFPVLRAVSTQMKTWEGPDGVENGLVNELSRLTMIAYATDSGWQQIPLQLALQREILDEDSHAEVLSSLTFFFVSRVGPKALRADSLQMAGSPRDWVFTSLGFTEYLGSLRTLKPEPDTTMKQSSVIS